MIRDFGLVVAMIALALTGAGQAGEPQTNCKVAPFGLTWAETSAATKKNGARLTIRDQDGHTRSYIASGLKKPADFFTVNLADYWYDLLYTTTSMRSYEDDNTGSQAKAAYYSFKTTLTQKYGPPADSTEHDPEASERHRSLWSTAMKLGQGLYFSRWHSGGVQITLGITADDDGTNILLGYECQDLSKRAANEARKRDASGL